MLHLNIRSLTHNFSPLTDLLNASGIRFSVIGLTETWLKESSHMVDIDGFKFVHKYREKRHGGGVGLYVSTHLKFKLRPDLNISNENLAESMFIEILRPTGNIIVGVIYRPPEQNVKLFIDAYNELLDKISLANKWVYIMGDFNLDLMKYQRHAMTGEFLEAMYSRMLYPLIACPTRITAHSATLIDNIFTNCLGSQHVNGLIFQDISDHLPIFAINLENLGNIDKNRIVHIRDTSAANLVKFRERLASFDWSMIQSTN